MIRIAHAKWDSRRHAPLARLLKQLGTSNVTVHSSLEKEHASVWASRLWRASADSASNGHTCYLNDDVTVCPRFAKVCDAMVDVAGNHIISLHTTSHHASKNQSSWLASYWLTGPGYIIPNSLIGDLLEFVRENPDLSKVNEDNVIMHWLWSRQTPAMHCVPAIVSHDVTVPSTLGYDKHPLRTAEFTWKNRPGLDLTDSRTWFTSAQMVECPWMPESKLKLVEALLASRRAKV